MALRKCPGCKNTIAAESESCPICGCNPRTRQLQRFLMWGAAVVMAGVLLQGPIRQHLPMLHAPATAHAQPREMGR
jgi:uncharacterized paraquat-inducible protein A